MIYRVVVCRFIKLPAHDVTKDDSPKEYVESPFFDAVLPTKQQICTHKGSCDAYLYQVTSLTV